MPAPRPLIRAWRINCIWLLATAVLLAGAGIAQAGFHFQERTETISPEEQQLAAEITAFLKVYEAAYNKQDYKTVKSLWQQDGNPIYMAEEVPFPLYGQERLESYFNPVPGKQILEGIDNRYSQVRAKYVAPDVAVATYRLDYDIKIIGMPATGGWDRVMAVFVRDAGQWKLSAYTEAPMGPATMVKKMMQKSPPADPAAEAAYAATKATIKTLSEAAVSPGFDAFLDSRKGLKPTH
ncbi:MAG: nuclear transport factor 2 family protein [Gammaproteobacteria bacterium]|jgi:ketosteroid isomerase-like protein|nr:nuclear transport factor 2 family protein [Gammaproteobacteria bacterium]